MTEERNFLISQKQAQEIVDYLKQRPFQEVYHLINNLVRLQVAEGPAPAPTPPTPTPLKG